VRHSTTFIGDDRGVTFGGRNWRPGVSYRERVGRVSRIQRLAASVLIAFAAIACDEPTAAIAKAMIEKDRAGRIGDAPRP